MLLGTLTTGQSTRHADAGVFGAGVRNLLTVLVGMAFVLARWSFAPASTTHHGRFVACAAVTPIFSFEAFTVLVCRFIVDTRKLARSSWTSHLLVFPTATIVATFLVGE